jgi:hypothetical protein
MFLAVMLSLSLIVLVGLSVCRYWQYCTRRIITCTLGCGLKMTEEAWLRPLETPLSVEEKEEKRLRQKRKDAESHQHVTTIQENHEVSYALPIAFCSVALHSFIEWM